MLRTIIESQQYWNSLNSLEPDIKRTDEMLSGVTWVLSRAPEKGKSTGVDSIYAIPTEAYDVLSKALVIYYVFNSDNIILLDATAPI